MVCMSQDERTAGTRSDLGLSGTGIRRGGYCDGRVLPTFVSVQFRRIALKDLRRVLIVLPMRRRSMTPSMPSPVNGSYP
jgi:hypothetical protein